MRTIRRTAQFKRDYRREKRGRHRTTIDQDLEHVLALLVADEPLPENFSDHPMASTGGNIRNCHIKPDLILLYSKATAGELRLTRLGSHSELGI